MQRIDISHLDDPRLVAYLSLSGRQLKHVLNPKAAVMIAESRLVIEVALKEGFSPRSLFIDERRFESCADIFAQLDNDIPVFVAPTELMSKVVGYTVTRGILGCFSRPKLRDAQEVLAGAKRIAVLEDIVDVSNVGAIFRSAAALGADAVLLAPTCADPLNRRSLRVSMGTVLQVPWAYLPTPWPQECLELLHKEGFFCAALALDEHALRLDDPALVQHEKLALFLGTEGSGLAPEVLAGCDASVIIPMSHGIDSLNVAAASAVAFWQLCQKE